MTITLRRWMLLTAVFAPAAHAAEPAPSFEMIAASLPHDAAATASALRNIDLIDHVVRPPAEAPRGGVQKQSAPVADVELASLYNRQERTTLHYSIGGVDVVLGGHFEDSSNAFVSVSGGAGPALYYNIRGLYGNPRGIKVGTVSTTLSLDADIFHKLRSRLVLTDTADNRILARPSLQELLEATSAAGETVRVKNQVYKLFYANAIHGGKVDPNTREFVFLYGPPSNFYVFIIPESSVPTTGVASFSLNGGVKVGLSRDGGRLKVYELP